MKVYEALAKAFVAEGTSDVFGMMGDANQYWIDALDALGVSIYEVRHEGAGLSMADGYARIKGVPGVCTTTSGPGTSQVATAALVASRARTPIVAFCGDTEWGNIASPQYFNQERFAEACEFGYVRVHTPERAYDAVQEAFYRARRESRPIMLSAAMDIQLAQFDDDEIYTPSTALFTSGLTYPNPDDIKRACDIIEQSERPLIIAGRGAKQSGAGQAILKMAQRIGALTATSLLAKNWLNDLDEYHAGISGLFATRTAIELFQESDCVIGIGASLNHYTTEHGYLFPDAKFIHIDTQDQVVMGDGRSAECFIHADARLAVEVLDSQLEDRSFHQIGYRTPEVKDRLVNALDDPTTFEIEPGTLDPRIVCRTLDEVIPSDVGMTFNGGHQTGFGVMLCTRPRSLTLSNTHHFGCIGQGLVVAIGATVASGKQPIALLEGDASFMMHLAEFETAVRYNLPLLVVVLNDQQLGAEVHKAKAKGLNPELARISTPDLGAVGASLGGRGALIRTVEELKQAAAAFVADPSGPMLLDVRTSPNVVSVPYRRLIFGEDA